MSRRCPWLLRLACLLLPLAGCVDVRGFAGAWSGKIVPDDQVRQGFDREARVERLQLANIDLRGVTATLTTSDRGYFDEARLTPVVKYASDPLATLTFDGSPLRSYLLFAPLASEPQGPPVWLLVSLYSDDHVELRAIRGNDLFGVFHLTRSGE